MRLSRILMRQILVETGTYTVLAFTAVVLTLLGQNLIRRMDALTTIGLTPADLGVVVNSLVIMLTPYAIPIAFLFGCLVCLRRMAADGEILAMRTNGVGSTTLLVPTTALGLIISLLCGYLMLFAEFDSRRQLLTVFKQAAMRGGGLEADRTKVTKRTNFSKKWRTANASRVSSALKRSPPPRWGAERFDAWSDCKATSAE